MSTAARAHCGWVLLINVNAATHHSVLLKQPADIYIYAGTNDHFCMPVCIQRYGRLTSAFSADEKRIDGMMQALEADREEWLANRDE